MLVFSGFDEDTTLGHDIEDKTVCMVFMKTFVTSHCVELCEARLGFNGEINSVLFPCHPNSYARVRRTVGRL